MSVHLTALIQRQRVDSKGGDVVWCDGMGGSNVVTSEVLI